MLLPGADAAVRSRLDRWCEANSLRPRVVGERFDDSALMKAFGAGGAGIFPAPTATSAKLERMYGVRNVGSIDDVHETYYAVSPERKITHPAVLRITETARNRLFREE